MTQLSLFHDNKPVKKTRLTLYIDGASRGNPGPASVGFVIKREDTVIQEHGYFIGIKTNNQAEYAALVIGLQVVSGIIKEHDELLIISDSELLVKQLNGHYRVKDPTLQRLFNRAKHMLKDINHRITHVLRAHNNHADELANKALDNKTALTEQLASCIH